MNEDEIKKRIELATAQYAKKGGSFIAKRFESQIVSQLFNALNGSSHNNFKTRLIDWGLRNKKFIKRIPILGVVGRKFFKILIISKEIKMGGAK
jgi:hypothetical protein